MTYFLAHVRSRLPVGCSIFPTRNKVSLVSAILLALCAKPAISQANGWTSRANLSTSDFPCQDDLKVVSFQNSPEYTVENAYLSLKAAWLSHNKNTDEKLAQLKNWGFERMQDLPSDDFGSRGYIADHGDYIMVAFRGTESKKDFASNTLFYQSEAPSYLGAKGAWMHKGMKSIYNQLRPSVHKIMADFGGLHKPLYFAGHSLGGSLAVIAALDLANLGAQVNSIYTFGQPKVGNLVLAHKVKALLGDRLYRIALDSDITSRVPPAKETAEDFSNIFPATNPKMRTSVKSLVTSINYSTETGFFQLMNKNGNLTPTGSGELDFEHSYWQKISSTLSDRDDLQSVIEFMASRFTDHMPKVYICAMAKNFVKGQ
ncbi:MAG: lipase family protein [Pseudomonadota bacterium]